MSTVRATGRNCPNTSRSLADQLPYFKRASPILFTAYSAFQGQFGQTHALEKIFKSIGPTDNVTRFFIKAGSFDGVLGSNTLRIFSVHNLPN